MIYPPQSVLNQIAFLGLRVILMSIPVMLAQGHGLDFITKIYLEYDEISVACTEI